MNLLFTLVATTTLVTPPDALTRQQLAELIVAAQAANMKDVSFDYEGQRVILKPPKPPQISVGYTGSYHQRADGAYKADIYNTDTTIDGQLIVKSEHSVGALINGKSEVSQQKADQRQATIAIRKKQLSAHSGTGNFRSLWMAQWVVEFAQSPYVYEFQGGDRVDGAECVVVRFRLVIGDLGSKEKASSHLFWVDLNRGGHVLRHELRQGGENVSSRATVRLGRYEPGPGQVTWLPVSGRVDGFVSLVDDDLKKREVVWLKDAVTSDSYDLLPATVRFDQGLKDEVFSVKGKAGDVVSDEVRKARYEFGQYMVRAKSATTVRPPTDAEIKANLDQMLKDSKVMANELKATSPATEGPGLLTYWPWATAGLATLGAGFLYFKSRRRYP